MLDVDLEGYVTLSLDVPLTLDPQPAGGEAGETSPDAQLPTPLSRARTLALVRQAHALACAHLVGSLEGTDSGSGSSPSSMWAGSADCSVQSVASDGRTQMQLVVNLLVG